MQKIAEQGVVYPATVPAADEIFAIPFLRYDDFYTESASYIATNARVVFPANNQYILVDEKEKRYISTKTINDLGLSADNLYRKIATVAYVFWIKPDDAERLVNILLHRHNLNVESEKLREEAYDNHIDQMKIDANEEPSYDLIDSNIYHCVLFDRLRPRELIVDKKLKRALDTLSKVCKKNGGHFYRRPNPKAQYSIIFAPRLRRKRSVDEIHKAGRRAVTFESVLSAMNLEHLYDIEKLKSIVFEDRIELKKRASIYGPV